MQFLTPNTPCISVMRSFSLHSLRSLTLDTPPSSHGPLPQINSLLTLFTPFLPPVSLRAETSDYSHTNSKGQHTSPLRQHPQDLKIASASSSSSSISNIPISSDKNPHSSIPFIVSIFSESFRT